MRDGLFLHKLTSSAQTNEKPPELDSMLPRTEAELGVGHGWPKGTDDRYGTRGVERHPRERSARRRSPTTKGSAKRDVRRPRNTGCLPGQPTCRPRPIQEARGSPAESIEQRGGHFVGRRRAIEQNSILTTPDTTAQGPRPKRITLTKRETTDSTDLHGWNETSRVSAQVIPRSVPTRVIRSSTRVVSGILNC